MMINISQAALALAEGFGLALSPCILPILPLILASSATGGRTRPLQIVAGFILSFTAFSLISRQILAATGVQQDQIQFWAFALLLVFGLVMLVPKLEEKFASLTGSLAGKAQNLSTGAAANRAGGGLLVGALIGLVWTPCAGPILAVALLQVIQSQTSLDAVVTIAAFSIGAGLPMLAIGYSGKALIKYVRALSRHAVAIRRAMGVVIVIFALMGLFGFNIAVWAVSGDAPQEVAAADSGNALVHGLAAPYAAPEIEGIAGWLNSEPLNIAALRGKVVLIDFWTYSCINCIRTFPYIKSWHAKYKDSGLVIIGVHAPEFEFEGKRENIEKAIAKFGIAYPVAMDNDFTTWKNYKNRYWPAHYLIDREGRVVYTHFGEGHYDVTENNIRYLLGIHGKAETDAGASVVSDGQTPETYLGTLRSKNEVAGASAENLPLHSWTLGGAWKRAREHLESGAAGDTLTLHYNAKKVFLVMESADGAAKTVHVTHNGVEKTLSVTDSALYDLVEAPAMEEGTVSVRAAEPGLRLFAFTFEG